MDGLLLDNVSRNFVIISSNIHNRYKSVIRSVANFLNTPEDKVLINPDVYYLSLPLIDKSGNIVRSLSNEEILLKKYDLIDKIDSNRCGTEIFIDQIRDLIQFTNISSHNNKKIIIINDATSLNNESSAALLKTLEEVNSNCTFILLCENELALKDTILSRCQKIKIEFSKKQDLTNYESFFYSVHPFLENHADKYELNRLIETTALHIDNLLNKTQDPIEIAGVWANEGNRIIIEIIHIYLIYLSHKYINLNDKQHIKKISNIYEKMFRYKKDLALNVNPKYLLNNISIELAT